MKVAGACQPADLVRGEFVLMLWETKRQKMKSKNPPLKKQKQKNI